MIFNLMLGIILIICFITDLRYQKIYNKVIFPALILSMLLHVAYYGLDGFKLWIIGFAAGLGILLIPYFLGGIGAGDVKLLGLIGAIKGYTFVFNTALYMAIIGGIMALAIVLYHKQASLVFKCVGLWIFSLFNGISFKLEMTPSSFSKKYPYGIAIVGGALICLFFKEAWII
jgi:prepilin peptidase CpaA